MSKIPNQPLRYLLPLLLVCGFRLSPTYGDLTYVFTGVGSGSLGQSTFNEAVFTITAQGDETQVTNPFANIFRLDGVSAVLDITGLPSASFTFVPNLSVNQTNSGTNPSVGIADPIQDRAIFFVGNTSLANYDLRLAFPSIDGRALTNADNAFPTTQGAFIISSASAASFRAVPEPTSPLLLMLAMTACCNVRRRFWSAPCSGSFPFPTSP